MLDHIKPKMPLQSLPSCAMPSTAADPWGFALSMLRRMGLPPGIVPTQLSITVSTGQAVSMPIFPPSGPGAAIEADFAPSPAQQRILAACRETPKSATQLKAVEPNLYRNPGGIVELQAHGLIDRNESGRYVVTEMGRELFDSQSDEGSEE